MWRCLPKTSELRKKREIAGGDYYTHSIIVILPWIVTIIQLWHENVV